MNNNKSDNNELFDDIFLKPLFEKHLLNTILNNH